MKLFNKIFKSRLETSGTFFVKLKNELKITPRNRNLFKKAFTHSSMNIKDSLGNKLNFERLEFLGDSILSTIVSEYLFANFPNSKEGDLTKLRAKIVSRKNLNLIGEKLKLVNFLKSNKNKKIGNNIHGNLLESLIGAIFIDRGFEKSKIYVINNILKKYVNLKEINLLILSYKSSIIEWAQKTKNEISFNTITENKLNQNVNFCSELFIKNTAIAKSYGSSKKESEESVSKKAFFKLKIKN